MGTGYLFLTLPNHPSHGDEASCEEGDEEGDEGHEGDESHEGDEGNEGHEGHEGHEEEEVRWRSLSCCAGSFGMAEVYLGMQVPQTFCTYSIWFRTACVHARAQYHI